MGRVEPGPYDCGQRCIELWSVAGAVVALLEEDFAAGRDREQPSLLPGIALQLALDVPSQRRACAGENAAGIERRGPAPLETERFISPQRGVGEHANAGCLSRGEMARMGDAAASDQHQLCACLMNLVQPVAQLRGRLFAVRSTEMTQKHEQNRTVGGKIDEPDAATVDVQHRQRVRESRQEPVHCGFRFSRNASTPSWKSRLM
jgi:hypothetical protein